MKFVGISQRRHIASLPDVGGKPFNNITNKFKIAMDVVSYIVIIGQFVVFPLIVFYPSIVGDASINVTHVKLMFMEGIPTIFCLTWISQRYTNIRYVIFRGVIVFIVPILMIFTITVKVLSN